MTAASLLSPGQSQRLPRPRNKPGNTLDVPPYPTRGYTIPAATRSREPRLRPHHHVCYMYSASLRCDYSAVDCSKNQQSGIASRRLLGNNSISRSQTTLQYAPVGARLTLLKQDPIDRPDGRGSYG